ncbi:MAG: ribonuclease HII [Patescibacteria group bacterium]
MKAKYLVGIDEAGRGPLAGPVAVAAVLQLSRRVLDSDKSLGRLQDSKKLSSKKREAWFEWLKRKQTNGDLKFTVALVSEKIIDRVGIVRAIKIGIKQCLDRLDLKSTQCRVLLDGGLRAPKNYQNQKTIIRGDEQEPVIALASIVAKVTRDRRLNKLAKIYPNYSFEIHKGYGTRAHYSALRRHGFSPLHRRTFIIRRSGPV